VGGLETIYFVGEGNNLKKRIRDLEIKQIDEKKRRFDYFK